MAATSAKSSNPMLSLLFYSIMMVTLPIFAFFVTQYGVESWLHVTTSKSYIYATACSVIIIHIILGIFVYKAYKDDKVVPHPADKED
ncbi:hypothetical protein JTE90_004858 [Oedothorax gibbosus]|uniref:Vacuolar ATPase assembly integral membrane protein VMA21 homolog n=1 Tax=Oedothorax gibbosus TaxID=931172 RepID=A0AAV6UTJ1_9ARAC|nr:hypothetical protein JTE90_004858 [Oedothorax gibbosus]